MVRGPYRPSLSKHSCKVATLPWKETPSRKAGTGVSSAEPKASQPTFLYRNQGSRNALLSKCLGPGAPSGCHGAPTVKSPQIRHKQPTPPSPLRSRGSPLFIPFRPASQALDRRLRSPWPRAQYRPASEKNMQEQFFFYADLPITPKRLEHFEPSYRPGTRHDVSGLGLIQARFNYTLGRKKLEMLLNTWFAGK